MKFFEKKQGLFVLGLIVGVGAAILASLGNPKNMAFCIACFIRDIAGSLHLHTAPVVQYFRPEIVGIIIGAFLLGFINKEARAMGGSSPAIRFILGFIMAVNALVFLGCPLRMVIRMAAGDISSYFGFAGFVLGVFIGVQFLKKGFSLGRAHPIKKENIFILPAMFVFLFVLFILVPSLFAFSQEGPGSMHAPLIASLIVGLFVGAIAQKSRMCFAGAFRDIFIIKDFSLFSIILGIFVVMLAYNIFTNNFTLVAFGPIAHAQNLWNVLSMIGVGLAAVFLGGCPLRQTILASTGSSDSFISFIGMLIGAAFAHNFSLASSAASLATSQAEASPGGPGINGQVFVVISLIVLVIVGFWGLKKQEN